MTAPLTGALQSAPSVGAAAQGPAGAVGGEVLDAPSSGGGRASHRGGPGAARPEGLVADMAEMGLGSCGEGEPRGGRRRGALMYLPTEKVTRNPELTDKKGKMSRGCTGTVFKILYVLCFKSKLKYEKLKYSPSFISNIF